MNKNISRRDFFERVGGGAAASALLFNSAGANQAQNTTKSVLTASDFSFVGAFRLPNDVNGEDAGYGQTLTHRRVNGELRFLTTTVRANVYEAIPPVLSVVAPYPFASIGRFWGDVYQGKRRFDGSNRNGGRVWGLYWDAPDNRLYWSYGDEYNTVSGDDPSLGYSTLNDADGTSSSVGSWRFAGRGCKSTMGGVTAIPVDFANQYCGGKRLGAGFGGYYSIVGVGPAHLGPALCAFAPPSLSANPDLSSLPFNNLVGYPFNSTPYTAPDRAHRDTDYTNEFDNWNPRNGVGYFSWTDYIWQGGVWVDTTNKHGLIYFPTLGNGRTWYETSTLHATRASHWWFVYDPADLAQVAQNQKQQWQIQPRNTWAVNHPGLPNPLPGWANEPSNMITGATFDDVTNTLYVAVRFAWHTPGNPNQGGHTIYAYKVNSTPTAAAVIIAGRVVTPRNRGISNVRLTLTDSNGTTRIVITNPFGYYRFTDVAAGTVFTLEARHKRFAFDPTPRIATATADVDNFNFTSIN